MHHLGPDLAQSADELMHTAASRFGASPTLAFPRLPSSPIALARRPDTLSATPRESRDVAAAPETGPAPVDLAMVSEFRDYDPFSTAADPYRPILLASASPQLDDYLWATRAAGAPPASAVMVASAERDDDRLAQVAEAGSQEPEPGDDWTVLLGTGQRLSLGVAASAVAIASPDIADVQLLSPRVLFVMGRSLGRTTVSVLGEDGSVFERDVSVVLDLQPLRGPETWSWWIRRRRPAGRFVWPPPRCPKACWSRTT
jgi:hypothetical protein